MGERTRRRFLSGTAAGLCLLGGCLGGDAHATWTADIGPSSAVSVVDETAYVGTLEAVYALDPETGDPSWTYRETHEEINQPPRVHDGIVYASLNGEGGVHAINAGEKKWVFDDVTNDASQVTVHGDGVYFTANGYLHELDRTDGTLRQRVELDTKIPATPVVIDDEIYLQTPKRIWAFDRSSLSTRWTRPVPEYPESSQSDIATVDNRIYAAAPDIGGIAELDRSDGSVIWQGDLGSVRTPVATKDTIYATEGRWIHAYTLDGQKKWKSDINYTSSARTFSVPTPSPEAVYAVDLGSDDPHLYAVDASTGESKWSAQIQNAPRPDPANSSTRVFVPTDDGLIAFKK